MSLKAIIKKQIEVTRPDKLEISDLKEKTSQFMSVLKSELKKTKGEIDVFAGGSFAKETMLKNVEHNYDVDIFVRFDWRYDNISDLLEKPLQRAVKRLGSKIQRIHGSRDYFRVFIDGKNYFEVIPVTKIKKPKEERNVTDLSYFHVSYVKKKIKNLEDQVRVAKAFMKANKVYGAETYVRGFSGYGIELLIIYYKSFEKMLRELLKIKKGERIVIDLEKKYKKKDEVFFEMNENKLQSPIILIDPTYKERNALAALSRETFERFQETARQFLAKPSEEFFRKKSISLEELEKEAKRNKAELIKMEIETDKQAGDIAGTKLKKFHYVVEKEIKRYFELLRHEFEYLGQQKAVFYLIVRPKKEIVRIGPPIHMKKNVSAFKKEHASTYEKNGFIHARLKINFNARSYIDTWKKGNKKLFEQMSITDMRVN